MGCSSMQHHQQQQQPTTSSQLDVKILKSAKSWQQNLFLIKKKCMFCNANNTRIRLRIFCIPYIFKLHCSSHTCSYAHIWAYNFIYYDYVYVAHLIRIKLFGIWCLIVCNYYFFDIKLPVFFMKINVRIYL